MAARIPAPIKDIACQHILMYPDVVEHGTLRLRNAVNKILESKVKLATMWPRVYVVLHQCCIYIFKNETSKVSSKASSLFGFFEASACSTEENVSSQASWSFKVIRKLDTEEKQFFFSAPSESEMKKWIQKINQQIDIANGGRFSAISGSATLGTTSRVHFEPPVTDADGRPRLTSPSDLPSFERHDDSDSSYDEIVDPDDVVSLNYTDDDKGNRNAINNLPRLPPSAAGPKANTLPVTRLQRVLIKGTQDVKKPPPVRPKPAFSKQQSLSDRKKPTFEDDGVENGATDPSYLAGPKYVLLQETSAADRAEGPIFQAAYWSGPSELAEQTMRNLSTDGAYMIRNAISQTPNNTDLSNQTLLVRKDGIIRKFRINKDAAGRYSLGIDGPWFETRSQLMKNFETNCLPKLAFKLSQPWSKCTN